MRVLEFLLIWILSELRQVTPQGVARPPSAPKKKSDRKEAAASSEENSDKDEKKEERKPGASSSHYRQHTERNIEVEEADFYCLDGFQLNHQAHRCERNDDKQSELGCPFGWDYRDGECHTTDVRPADRYCLEGYDDVLGHCRRTLTAPKQLLCPPAYNHTEYGCVKDVETEPLVQCADGRLINGACVESVEFQPVVQCDPEFQFLGDHCGRRLVQPATFHCPAGFAEEADTCQEIERVPPTLVCPKGTALHDGLCHARRLVPYLSNCREGTLDPMADLCTFQVTAPPTDTCPPGAEALGDTCLKEEMAEPELGCPSGTQLSDVYGCVGGKGHHPPSKSCPPGFSLQDKGTCRRRLTLPREKKCPANFVLRGIACVATEFAHPQKICPEGALELGKECWQVETFMPENVCAKNLALDVHNGYCYGQVKMEKTPICERGTWDASEKGCVLAEIAPSMLSCPPNARMRNGVCQEDVLRAPTVACPHDFTLEYRASDPTCLGRALAEGEIGCVTPYKEAADGCVFTEILPKVMDCINGGHLKDTSCITQESQQALVLCPDGYKYQQDTQLCKKLMWSQPVPICREGFIYDNLVQKCYRLKKKEDKSTPKKPAEENLLPLEVQPDTTTTTTKKNVKVKVQPRSGKENFIPMATFTGQDAVKQASAVEALKMVNAASGQAPQSVRVPPVSVP